MTGPTRERELIRMSEDVPYAYKAELNAAMSQAVDGFHAKGEAPWRFEPAAIAGYCDGFEDGWHARDAEVARLRAEMNAHV